MHRDMHKDTIEEYVILREDTRHGARNHTQNRSVARVPRPRVTYATRTSAKKVNSSDSCFATLA